MEVTKNKKIRKKLYKSEITQTTEFGKVKITVFLKRLQIQSFFFISQYFRSE